MWDHLWMMRQADPPQYCMGKKGVSNEDNCSVRWRLQYPSWLNPSILIMETSKFQACLIHTLSHIFLFSILPLNPTISLIPDLQCSGPTFSPPSYCPAQCLASRDRDPSGYFLCSLPSCCVLLDSLLSGHRLLPLSLFLQAAL